MTNESLIMAASQITVGALFRGRAIRQPNAIAIETAGGRSCTYGELHQRVNRTASVLRSLGVERGDRVALLSENRTEYVELQLACAKLGAIAACQNYRLAAPEIQHCVNLVSPRVTVVSGQFCLLLEQSKAETGPVVVLGDDYEGRLAEADAAEPSSGVCPEDGLLILYTSGTTGLPKGAVISHRAALNRFAVMHIDVGIAPTEPPVVWPPLFHMIGSESTLATLLGGGKLFLVDGYRIDEILQIIGREAVGWLPLLPGAIQPLIDALEARPTQPVSVKVCGAMADLVPPEQIAQITRLLNAPFVNSFGATETGAPPATANFLPVGEAPQRLSKRQSSFCEIRLVDADGQDVPVGQPGELLFRGPTLFSGYWMADQTNAEDFQDGWFHMGDVLVRNPDGTLDYVDRAKYMIKSGGENIYPAEIERVLLSDPRVVDAVVVRKPDAQWGEVPIAVVAVSGGELDAQQLLKLCRDQLAGFKQPKEIVFVQPHELPRSTTGKIQRQPVEVWLQAQTLPPDRT